MSKVVFDEARDEVVRVVVAIVHSQRDRLIQGFACRFEELGTELLGEEVIVFPVVDETSRAWRPGSEGRS